MEVLLCLSTGFIVGVAFEIWRMARRLDGLEQTFCRYGDEILRRLDGVSRNEGRGPGG